jgi:large subunit ribosomal protein L29
MANKPASDLRELPDDQLVARLDEEKDAYLKLRFRHVTGQLDNSAELTRVRRQVGRINTEIRARQIAAAEGIR